ncbi:MAG: hypothetical protein NT009_01160 [Proteobacteria bacterium]|nr:hypothetical protein [Pseudomonadota bacterium]
MTSQEKTEKDTKNHSFGQNLGKINNPLTEQEKLTIAKAWVKKNCPEISIKEICLFYNLKQLIEKEYYGRNIENDDNFQKMFQKALNFKNERKAKKEKKEPEKLSLNHSQRENQAIKLKFLEEFLKSNPEWFCSEKFIDSKKNKVKEIRRILGLKGKKGRRKESSWLKGQIYEKVIFKMENENLKEPDKAIRQLSGKSYPEGFPLSFPRLRNLFYQAQKEYEEAISGGIPRNIMKEEEEVLKTKNLKREVNSKNREGKSKTKAFKEISSRREKPLSSNGKSPSPNTLRNRYYSKSNQ